MCHEVKIYDVSREPLLIKVGLWTYLLELGTSVRLFTFPTFKLHPLDRESFLFMLEIPCTGILRHVREENVAEERDW